MQLNQALEQSEIVRWSESPCNQSGRKGKGLWRKGFAEEPSLEVMWNNAAAAVVCSLLSDAVDMKCICTG